MDTNGQFCGQMQLPAGLPDGMQKSMLPGRPNAAEEGTMLANPRLFNFVGGEKGIWRVRKIETIVGDPIPHADRMEIILGSLPGNPASGWSLRGITSNERYVMRDEKAQLAAKQPGLNRAEATLAALIPIRKNAQWWALTQDERRRIFEEQSRHIQIGLGFLPAIARRLHHCRDLGENEPFDFLTWFEFSPENEPDFDHLVAELRASPEWKYVDREIDIRFAREAAE